MTPELKCPYCKLELGTFELLNCPACRTLHHTHCWQRHGGCSVFGCSVLQRRRQRASHHPFDWFVRAMVPLIVFVAFYSAWIGIADFWKFGIVLVTAGMALLLSLD